MDKKRKVSMMVLGLGAILIILGFFAMNSNEVTRALISDERDGMYVLSFGAVLAIFATSAIFDKTDQRHR